MNKLTKFCKYALLFIVFALISELFLSRLFISVDFGVFEEHIRQCKMYCYLNFYTLFIVGILLLIGDKLKIKDKYREFIVLLIPFVIGIVVLFIYKFPVASDSYSCWNIVLQYDNLIKEGSLLMAIDGYLSKYPFQYGFISVLRIFNIIFKDNGFFIYQLFQIVLVSLSNLVLYKLACLFSKKNIDNWFVLCSVFWIVPWFLAGYVYGFALGLCFAIFSLYYFVKYNRSNDYRKIIISLLFLIVAVLVKMNYALLGISYVLYAILISGGVLRKRILSTIICVLGLLISMNIVDVTAKLVDNITLPKGSPLISWFIMSNPVDQEDLRNEFNPRPTVGYYTGYNYQLPKEANYDDAEMDRIVKEDLNKSINYIINNPVRSLKYYALKIIDTWNSNDFLARLYMAGEYLADENNPVTVDLDRGVSGFIIKEFTNVGALLLLLGSVVYIVKHRNSDNSEFAIILIWFIGGFLYHLLFETKAIYVYPYMTILMPIAAIGLSELQDKFKSFTSDKKNKKYVYATIPLVLIVAFIYNTQKFVLPTFESYADISNEMLVEKNVQLTQNVTLDNDLKVDAIEFEYSGHLNENVLEIAIVDGTSTIQTISVNQDDLDKSQNWIRKSFDSIRLANNKTYRINFNVVGDSYSDFTIIYGPTAWDNDSVIINGEEYQNSTINFKLLTKEYSRWYYYQNNKVQYVSDMYYN